MPKTNKFRTSLTNPNEFTIAYELVPGQGFGGKQVERLLDFSRKAKADGRIKALSITDNPGGNSALAPVAIGSELLQIGIEPLIHFSLKDKNRSQVVSHILVYQRMLMHSLLVMGGDFPRPGYYGQAKPVYDLDTIQALQLMQDMENGCYPDHQSEKKQDPLPPHILFKGCVVSPFKTTEAEQVWQYAKLLHKVRAGADFIITQLGYDIRKFTELMTFLKLNDIDLPVLGNVFIPSLPVARALATGRIPGVLLAEGLVTKMEREAAAGDTRARLNRAASMIVCLKKLGFQGVHIGGNCLNFEDIKHVLDRVEQMEGTTELSDPDCDFPIKDCWYYFKSDQSSADKPSLSPLILGSRPGAAKVHALSHHLLFSEQTLTGRLFGRFCLFCARGKCRTKMLRAVERFIKRLLFNCRMCGDCTLARSAYLCPQSGCPKQLVNGPCGGSREGYCEVFPERRCFWVRVYDRLDPHTTIETLTESTDLHPKDWALEKTSSWINHFKNNSPQL
jgi:methylenetetrahydrofolate reductase (NADPH)